MTDEEQVREFLSDVEEINTEAPEISETAVEDSEDLDYLRGYLTDEQESS